MKSIIKNILAVLVCSAAFVACEKYNIPEPVRTQYPEDQSYTKRDNDYYRRLRAYKQSEHKLAFGWFGSWTAIGASEQCRLRSIPDSMDIISMWSTWHSLNKQQMEDKAFVQEVLGTKVVFCISAKDVPSVFKEDGAITENSLINYARAWGKDSMDKYKYDGIDIDYETASDHLGPLNTTPGLFKRFCEELSKYIGPKSGTGRLFIIDGNIDYLDEGIPELCDYAVSQAYACSSASGGFSSLVQRTTSAVNKGWSADKIIFTENFESYWKTGGVTHTTMDGKSMESLLGMAYFARYNGSAGFGSYHMEYEYGHSDMPYKYMRRAIQLANPAPTGDYSKNLVTLDNAGEEKYTIYMVDGETLSDPYSREITASLSAAAASEVSLSLTVDNSLVDEYNDYYYTEYRTLDPSDIEFSGALHFAAGEQTCSEPVVLGFSKLSLIEEDVQYLVPVVIDFGKNKAYSANTSKKVLYLFIERKPLSNYISSDPDAWTNVPAEKIEPDGNWTFRLYSGTNDSGTSGCYQMYDKEGKSVSVSNEAAVTEALSAGMFDGIWSADQSTTYCRWVVYSSYWSAGGNFIVDMGKVQTVRRMRWAHTNYSSWGTVYEAYLTPINEIKVSEDGQTWKSITDGTANPFVPVKVLSVWRDITLLAPVKARYIRVYSGKPVSTGYSAYLTMSEFEVYAPKQ